MRLLFEDNDRDLLTSFVKRGDADAFELLVARHSALVLGLVRSRVSDCGIEKDVAQQVFILLAKKADSLLDHPSITGWISRTAVLECKKMMRREANLKKRESAYVEKVEIQDRRFSEEEFGLVHQVLGELPEDYQKAILLRYHDQKSFEEISEIVGRSPGAAQRLISRALTKLRDLVKGSPDQSGIGAAKFSALLTLSCAPKGSAAVLGAKAILTKSFLVKAFQIATVKSGLLGGVLALL